MSFSEVGKLIEGEIADLRALVVMDAVGVFEVPEGDLGAVPGPDELPLADKGLSADVRVDFRRLVPEAPRIGDFGVAASEDDRSEAVPLVVLPEDRLIEEGIAFPTTCRTAVDGDISIRLRELPLPRLEAQGPDLARRRQLRISSGVSR